MQAITQKMQEVKGAVVMCEALNCGALYQLPEGFTLDEFKAAQACKLPCGHPAGLVCDVHNFVIVTKTPSVHEDDED